MPDRQRRDRVGNCSEFAQQGKGIPLRVEEEDWGKKKQGRRAKKSIGIDTGNDQPFKRLEFLPAASGRRAAFHKGEVTGNVGTRCAPFLSACAESDRTSRGIRTERVHGATARWRSLLSSPRKEKNVEIGTVLVGIFQRERHSTVPSIPVCIHVYTSRRCTRGTKGVCKVAVQPESGRFQKREETSRDEGTRKFCSWETSFSRKSNLGALQWSFNFSFTLEWDKSLFATLETRRENGR